MKEKKMEIVKDGKNFCIWIQTKQEMWMRSRGVWKRAGLGLPASESSGEVTTPKSHELAGI